VSLAQHLASTIQAAVDHAISALKAIASAMEAALQALLAFVKNEILSLLTAAFAPIINGIDSYVSSVNQAFGTAYGTVSQGSQVTPSEANAVGSALSGSVFEVGLGIGAVVEVALVVLTPVDIGPSFIITTLLSVLVGTVLQALSTTTLMNDLGSPTGINSQSVNYLTKYTGSTPAANDGNYSISVSTFAQVMILTGKLALLPFSIGLAYLDYTHRGNIAYPGIALALVLTSLVIDLWMLSHPVPNLVMILSALLIGGLLVFFSVLAIKNPVYQGGLKILNGIDLGLSLLAAGFSVYELLDRFG
jgi:hypothetical protein